MFAGLNRLIVRMPCRWVAAVCVASVGLIGAVDHVTGLDISVSIFYLVPVSVATWYVNRRAGHVMALLTAVTSVAADLNAASLDARAGITIWNGLLHLGFMLIVSSLLDALHVHLRNEARLARTDPLTGVLNRRAFAEQLQYSVSLAARSREPLSLAYIDLDDFKRINDRDGHDRGDNILRMTAQALSGSVRRTDLVARLGGDEFALLLPDTDGSGAARILRKVEQAIAGVSRAEPGCVLTCSIGCVTFHDAPVNAETALKTADGLMYKVKAEGKNAIAFEVRGGNVAAMDRAGNAAPVPKRAPARS